MKAKAAIQSKTNSTDLSKEEIFFVTLLAWFLPGAGHWRLGLRKKAVIYGVVVLGLLLIGAWMGNFTIVSFRYHRYSFLLQACTGAVALATSIISSTWMQHVPNPTRFGDIGMTFTLIAGALNLLLVADAFDRACGGPFEIEEQKPSLTRKLWRRLVRRKS